MFDILYGWRMWHSQRIKWIFMILSLSVLAAAFSVIVQVWSVFLDDTPAWSNTDDKLVSVGLNKNGRLSNVQSQNIELLNKVSGIKNVTIFSFQSTDIRFLGEDYKNVNILFYDKNFTTVFKPDRIFEQSSYENNTVYATNSFAKKLSLNKQSENIGEPILLKKKNILVNKILPNNFQHFGQKPVDLYLPDNFLLLFFPFRNPNVTSTQIQMIMKSLPYYLGAATINNKTNLESLTRRWQNLQDKAPAGDVTFDYKLDMYIVKGIDFLPKQTQVLKKQVILLLVLFIGLAFVIIVNFISVIMSQAIHRTAEISIRYSLGASKLQLFRQFLIENTITYIAFILVSFIVALALSHTLKTSENFISYFSNITSFNWIVFSFSILLTIIFGLIFSFIPMLNLLKKSHFRRSKREKGLLKFIMGASISITQMTIALTALSFASSLIYSDYELKNSFFTDSSIYGWKLESKYNNSDMSHINQHLKHASTVDRTNALVATSSKIIREENLNSKVSLANSNSSSISTDSIGVTNNFFDVMNVQWISKGLLTSSDIVINKSLSNLLLDNIKSKQTSNLIGLSINFESFLQKNPLTISGIIEDMPHNGLGNESSPMLYTQFNSAKNLIPAELKETYIYSSVFSTTKAVLSLDFLNNDSFTLTPIGTIKSQLNALSTTTNMLMYTSSVIAFFLILLLFVGLHFQTKYYQISSSNKIGILLALGDNTLNLSIKHITNYLLLLICTSPFSFLILLYIKKEFKVEQSFEYSFIMTLLSFCVLSLGISISTYLQSKSFFKQPITNLLSKE